MYQNVPGEVSFYGKLFVNTSDKVRALAILSTSLDKVRGIAIWSTGLDKVRGMAIWSTGLDKVRAWPSEYNDQICETVTDKFGLWRNVITGSL